MAFFRSNKKNAIYSPAESQIFPLEELNDGVFSRKLLGDGIGFRFKGDRIASPCYGEVIMVAGTRHAIGMRLQNGAEILLHIGLETVALNGKGLNVHVKNGDRVRPGDLLIQLDLDVIQAKKIDLSSALIITNEDAYRFHPSFPKTAHTRDLLFSIDRKQV